MLTPGVRFYQRLGAVTIMNRYVMTSYDGNPEVMLMMAAAPGGAQVSREDMRMFVESIYSDVSGTAGPASRQTCRNAAWTG